MNLSKKNQYFVVVLVVILSFFSVHELRNASFDILPEFQTKKIQVQTEALGLSASEVENLVTINVEEMLTNTPWMEKLNSTSVNGLSSVDVTFSPDTDIMEARQMVSENLLLSQLIPNVSQESIIIQPHSTTNRAMAIGLSSNELSLIDISQLSRWNIRPALMSVPGVANVSIWGHRERQLQVQVDQNRITNTGISLEQVIKDTGNAFWMSNLTYLEASAPGSGGWIDTPNQRLEIQHILPIRNEKNLAEVPFSNLRYLSLGDVADVVEGHQPLIGDAVLSGGQGILLVIEKYPWSDLLDVTYGVESKLEELKVGLSGIEINTNVFRPANFVESMIDNLMVVFLISSILILVTFLVLFYKIRISIFAFLSIIMSFITTLLLLHLFNITFNTILIAGIVSSVGIVIDQIISSFRKSNNGNIQTALITILLVVPVLFLNGEIGLFYEPIAVSYTVSILVGIFFALFVFPSFVKLFSSETYIKNRDFLFLKKIKNVYSDILIKFTKIPSKILVVFIFLISILSISSLFFDDYSIFPEYNERTLVVKVENTPGTSLIEMNRIVNDIGNKLQKVEGVSNFGADIGRAITGDQITAINSAQLWVSIGEQADYKKTKDLINKTLESYPEIIKSVETYSQEIMGRYLTSNEKDLFVRVYGADYNELNKQALEVKEHISRIDGVIDPNVITESYTEVPGIEIEVISEIASLYGLKPGDVRRGAATLVNGLQVANRFEEQKVYQVAVWSIPEERRDLNDIKNLLIDTPFGTRVRLDDVADVRIAPMMSIVEREGMSRYLDVVFETRKDKKTTIKNLEDTIQDMEFPLEYHASVLGESTKNQNNFVVVIVIVLGGVFLLLQSIFNSWRLALLSLIIAPATISGGVLAMYVFKDGILSLGILLGLLVVVSLSLRNIIMIIGHYQSLEKEELFGKLLVWRGSKELLIQILTTAFVTSLIFLSVLFMGNVPGLELLYSMALVVLFGLFTSTIINIFVIPNLYLWACNINNHES